MQLTTNTAIDALDGNGFDFGKDLLRSGKNAFINSAIDGASQWALEIKQRQHDKQTQSPLPGINTDQIVVPKETTLPQNGALTKPIPSNSPIQYQPQSTPSQMQRNLNMIKRLKRRNPIIIRNNEGMIIKIINR